MEEFVHGTALTAAIRRALAAGKSDIAVAFWGDDACHMLQLPGDGTRVRVVCDARSGACNPSALGELLERGAKVKDLRGLHSKVYIGSHMMVVASANASANGLGEEGEEVSAHTEAGYVIERPEAILAAQKWFNNVFEQGSSISPSELPELRELWLRRQAGRPVTRHSKVGFLDILRSDPRRLHGRGLKVVAYDYEEPPKRVRQKAKSYYNGKPSSRDWKYPYYWDFPEVEVDALLLDFGRDGESIECNGVWKVQDVVNRGEFVPAVHLRKPFGLIFRQTDHQILAKIVKSLFDNGELEFDGSLMPIEEFAELIA